MEETANKTVDVVKDIQNKIINRELCPGDKLLPLRDLAIEYGTSRSVINSAIHILSTKGYLKVYPRHYVQVNDFLYSGSLDVIKDIYNDSIGELRSKTIKEVLNIRLFAELDAIKHIIDNKESISKLENILEKEKEYLKVPVFNVEDIAKLDCEFHEKLVSCSNNSVLFLLYMSFKDIQFDLVKRFYYSKAKFANIINAHNALVQSLLLKDKEKALLIWTELLKKGEDVVLGETK